MKQNTASPFGRKRLIIAFVALAAAGAVVGILYGVGVLGGDSTESDNEAVFESLSTNGASPTPEPTPSSFLAGATIEIKSGTSAGGVVAPGAINFWSFTYAGAGGANGDVLGIAIGLKGRAGVVVAPKTSLPVSGTVDWINSVAGDVCDRVSSNRCVSSTFQVYLKTSAGFSAPVEVPVVVVCGDCGSSSCSSTVPVCSAAVRSCDAALQGYTVCLDQATQTYTLEYSAVLSGTYEQLAAEFMVGASAQPGLLAAAICSPLQSYIARLGTCWRLHGCSRYDDVVQAQCATISATYSIALGCTIDCSSWEF